MKYTQKVWKQPIPTNLMEYTNNNKFAATVLEKLLLRASNADTTVYIKNTPVPVKRGQAVCGRFELAECFGLKQNESKRVWRIIDFLENSAHQLTKQKYKDCTIVTIKNYEEFVEMDNQATNQRPNSDQSMTTNKTIKSDKSVESEVISSVLQHFNTVMSKKYKVLPEPNLQYWLTKYTVEEIKQAISMIPKHHYWKNVMDNPTMLFRQKNPRQEPVDYIGELLNYAPKQQTPASGAEALIRRSITNSQLNS